MNKAKREAITLSLSFEDKENLAQVAEECGYANVTAFVRAIAQRRIEIATENNLSRRIDVLRDRINALSEQRDADWRAIAQLQEVVYKSEVEL